VHCLFQIDFNVDVQRLGLGTSHYSTRIGVPPHALVYLVPPQCGLVLETSHYNAKKPLLRGRGGARVRVDDVIVWEKKNQIYQNPRWPPAATGRRSIKKKKNKKKIKKKKSNLPKSKMAAGRGH
jgi:hypothetical protein